MNEGDPSQADSVDGIISEQLPLCHTPPRELEKEFLEGHILSGQAGDELLNRYTSYMNDGGLDRALNELNTETVARAVTINNARITAAHSIGDDPNVWEIGVDFDGGDSALHTFVLTTVEQWERVLDGKIRFKASGDTRALKVKFSGADQYVAKTRTIHIPTAKYYNDTRPGMKDAAVNMVLHEFGHAFGFEHEHFSDSCKALFDFKSAEFIAGKIGGDWKDTTVKNQITVGKSVRVCGNAHGCDLNSVMIYPIDANWTKSGISARRNTKLSKHDIACVRKLYNVDD